MKVSSQLTQTRRRTRRRRRRGRGGGRKRSVAVRRTPWIYYMRNGWRQLPVGALDRYVTLVCAAARLDASSCLRKTVTVRRRSAGARESKTQLKLPVPASCEKIKRRRGGCVASQGRPGFCRPAGAQTKARPQTVLQKLPRCPLLLSPTACSRGTRAARC